MWNRYMDVYIWDRGCRVWGGAGTRKARGGVRWSTAGKMGMSPHMVSQTPY